MSTNTEMYDDETLRAATPPNYEVVRINSDGDVTMSHTQLSGCIIETTADKMKLGHFHDTDRGLIERTFCVRPDLCHRVLNDMEYCEALKEHIAGEWGRGVLDKDVYEMAGILKESGHLEGFISDMKRDEYGWSEENGFSSNKRNLYGVHGVKN